MKRRESWYWYKIKWVLVPYGRAYSWNSSISANLLLEKPNKVSLLDGKFGFGLDQEKLLSPPY